MHKVIEADYCDCCGEKLDGLRVGDYVCDDMAIKTIMLPVTTEEETLYEYTKYKVIGINDICNKCMKKLLDFTNSFIINKQIDG